MLRNMLESGAELYKVCCLKYEIRTNEVILQQVSRKDLMHVTKIDASKTFLGALGVLAVLDFVEAHRGIEEINLCKNGVDHSCIERLCQILREGHSRLAKINLSFNILSTGSARVLWDALRQVDSVCCVNLEGCELNEEWMNRVRDVIKRNNAKNESVEVRSSTRLMKEGKWQMLFVLVIGGEANAKRFNDLILLPLGSYLASRMVRIAPVFIADDDAEEVVDEKIKMCRCSEIDGLPWCVGLLTDGPLASPQLLALKEVAGMYASLAPVADRGSQTISSCESNLRKDTPSLFLYYVPPMSGKQNKKVTVMHARDWLVMAGLSVSDASCYCTAIPNAVVLSNPTLFVVRSQSDFYSSIAQKYPDKSQLPLYDEEIEVSLEEYSKRGEIGELHEQALDGIMYYVKNHAQEFSVPMVVHGDPDVGKAAVLSCVASRLLMSTREDPPLDPSTCRVVTFDIRSSCSSLSLFLSFILTTMNPTASLESPSVDLLCQSVKESIVAYRGPPLVLLIAHLDALDTTYHSPSMVTDWIPFSFPSAVKIVISVRNDHFSAPALRQRCPQPYEVVCSPLPGRELVRLFKEALSARGLVLPGLQDFTRSVKDSLTPAEAAFLRKKESSHEQFFRIAAAHVECLARKKNLKKFSEPEVLSLINELPDTIAGLVKGICEYLQITIDTCTVKMIGLCLALSSPLPLTQLLYLCEEMGECKKYSSSVALSSMSHYGIVDWDSANASVAKISHHTVQKAILEFYNDSLSKVSVLLEQHLHRLVATLSPDISWAFRRLVPLMLSNGNFRGLQDLLGSSLHLDSILCGPPRSQLYLIDAFFRLITSQHLLAELSTAGLPVEVTLDTADILKSLMQVQKHRSNFLQEILLVEDHTILFRDAERCMNCANYPLIIAVNRGAEDTSLQTLNCDAHLLSCHFYEDFLAVVTASATVMVFCRSTKNCLAQRYIDLEGDRLIGVFMAPHSTVVVACKNSLYLWNFPSNFLCKMEGYRTSGELANLNSRGTHLVVQNISSGGIEILDLVARTSVFQVSSKLSSYFKACFAGPNILFIKNQELHILNGSYDTWSVLPHHSPIDLASGSEDGRIAITVVSNVFWVWTTEGKLISRVDAGLCPIAELCVDDTGSALITTQPNGAQLWKLPCGSLISKLRTDARGRTRMARFTTDRTKIVALTGAVLNLWDAQTGIPVGAYVSPSRFFTSLLEVDGWIYATVVSSDVVRVWNFHEHVGTEREALEGTITSNWLKNSKISMVPIETISVGENYEFVACIDEKHNLHVYFLSTGQKLDVDVGPVYSAIVLDADTIAYTTEGDLRVFYYSIKKRTTHSYKVPRSTLPDSKLRLISSQEPVFAVNVSSPYASALLVCEYSQCCSQFLNLCHHTGEVLTACFFGSFMYSIGKDDRYIYLWALHKRAERASYQHFCPIVSASCTTSGILIFIDNTGTSYRLMTHNISSPSRAEISCQRLSDVYPKIQSSFTKFQVKSVFCASTIVIFITSSGGIAIVSLDREGAVNHGQLPHGVTCVNALDDDSKGIIFIGTSNGDVLYYHLVVPTEVPRLTLL